MPRIMRLDLCQYFAVEKRGIPLSLALLQEDCRLASARQRGGGFYSGSRSLRQDTHPRAGQTTVYPDLSASSRSLKGN
jgi:hypothetical protein